MVRFGICRRGVSGHTLSVGMMSLQTLLRRTLPQRVWLGGVLWVWSFFYLPVTGAVAAVSYRDLIPAPVSVAEKAGAPFVVDARTMILYPQDRPEWKRTAELLAGYLGEQVGDRLAVEEYRTSALEPVISSEDDVIRFTCDSQIRKEGFKLSVGEYGVVIEAADGAGAFYAVQLLREILLSGRERLQDGQAEKTSREKKLSIPPVELEDYPSLSYRGAMLDVSRHFFSVAQVKRYIDLLAFHRLNHFHWHLTDDQGWRIESQKYPNLTKTGAWRGADNYGGYYTQQEIKEVVAYAAERYITVIPEIDMPGHTQAALAAYPQLGCTGSAYEVATEVGGVHKDVMCVGNDFTLPFVKDVLKEVAALFPSAFIHIGGDEVPKERWSQCEACQKAIRDKGLKDTDKHTAEEYLQSAFNEEIADYLRSIGKRMIGWDEVLSDSISRDITIMSWRGLGRAAAAARKGHSVIVSADSHLYLNHYQTINSEQEPRATGGLVEMKKVYETPFFSPDLTLEEKQRILGAETCLWTSFIDSDRLLDYMLLPRLAAFAEAAWCEERRGTYAHFLQRLPVMLNCYKQLGYRYADHFFTISASYRTVAAPGDAVSATTCKNAVPDRCLEISMESLPGTEIYYTLDGSKPTKSASPYKHPLQVDTTCVLRAVSYLSNGLSSDELTKEVVVNKATFRPVRLLTPPAERYQGEGGKVLADGIRSINFHNTGLWVGYYTSDMVAVIDLGSLQRISSVEVSALTDLSAWIMGPQAISVFLSSDGKSYKRVSRQTYQAPTDAMGEKRSELNRLSFNKKSARYVKVLVEPFKGLPKGHSGEGEPPFLFVDEIRVD